MTKRRSCMIAAPLLAALLLALGAGAARAQTSATGAITGVLVDAEGAPLAEALVTLARTQRGAGRTIETDGRGRFRFSFLAPGDYALDAELLGFAPTRITGIPVGPDEEVSLEIVLAVAEGPSPQPVIREVEGAALRAGAPAAAEWVPRLEPFPADRLEVLDFARLSSLATGALGFEGLAPSMGAVAVDGIAFWPARHPGAPGQPVLTGFSLHGFDAAMASATPFGIDASGGAAGQLAAFSLAPGSATEFAAQARWSGHGLPGSSVEAGDVPDFNEIQALLTARGASADQGVRFGAGVSLRRIERPFSRAWPTAEGTVPLIGQVAERGVNVAPYTEPVALADQSVNVFGAAELALGARHTVAASAHFASLPRVESVMPLAGLVSRVEGTDLVASLALRSAFGGVDNELRVALTSTERESAAGDSLPATFFPGDALALGSADQAAGARERAVRLSDALRLRAGAFAFTFGGDVTLAAHEVRRSPYAEAFFGGLAQLQADSGVLRRFEAGPAIADWSQPTYAGFGEVRVSPVDGMSLRAGARLERGTLPNDDVVVDTGWTRFSPTSNAAAEAGDWRVSPRVAVSWDVDGAHRWVVDLSGGIYHDRFDPLLLASWQLDNGSARAARTQGLLQWPFGAPAADYTGRRLLILNPAFEPVRTRRLSAGITHQLAPGTALQLGGAVRNTDRLPRRTDFNLVPVAPFRDQYDRGVYGTLLKQGGILAGQPGTGRRLSHYDEIAHIQSEAEANYWGISFGIESDVVEHVSVLARYTFSEATDDWFGARQAGWGIITPAGLDSDTWREGPADFDVPHRLAAGVSIEVAPVRVAALFRLESGLPFTPGFRYGVDANGDGDVGNDPAFVDPQLPGMAELIAAWPCLAESSGRFAARNGCRADALKALDVAAEVSVLRLGALDAAVLLEALGLLDSGRYVPDTALLLVDPAGTLDFAGDVITVPLVANPTFGAKLARREAGPRIRIGVSLAW